MCDAVGGGHSMPPMKSASTLPTPVTAGGGATTTAATPATSVAGASGGGTTVPAGAVGVGDLSSLLKQLTDAVALLGQAISRMGGAVGGGAGPIQAPPGKIPAPPVYGGGNHAGPFGAIIQRIDRHLGIDTPDATRTALNGIRTDAIAEQGRASANGANNPSAILRLGVALDRALLPAGDPRAAQLDQLLADARAFEAEAHRSGSTNQLSLQQLAQRHAAIVGSGPALPA